MTSQRAWATRLLRHRLVQPDNHSCGPASLVVARALRDEGYARLLADGVHPATGWSLEGDVPQRFAAETLAMHRRITGPIDLGGRLQIPWPRAFGTPFWAVARQLSAGSDRYRARPALSGLPISRVRSAVAAGLPVPAYVGDLWSPRHVVLIVGAEPYGGLRVYDPARGRVLSLSAAELEQGALPFGRWNRAWFVVLPES